MRVFEANSFCEFFVGYLKALPKQGRGELKRISNATGIHTTTLSQALKGGRPFSLEQVAKICECIGLNELETRYSLILLQKERSGTQQLRKIFDAELSVLKAQFSELHQVIKKDKVLSGEDKAIFYSNWYYIAAAVLSSIPSYQDVASLSERMGLPRQRVNEVVSFLIQAGICISKKGRLQPGSKSTHLESKSPLVSRHHSNWRMKAMERHPSLDSQAELAYSSPMSISETDAKRIRELLVDLIRRTSEIRDPSPCETAYCLNVDWFRI